MDPQQTIPTANRTASYHPHIQSKGKQGLGRFGFDTTLKRFFGNASLLLSGRAVRALSNLAATALAVRAVGLEVFGFLVLVHTFARVVSDLSRFQSWQVILRYGAPAIEQHNTGAFQRLLAFTFRLDILSATGGVLFAVLAAPMAGKLLGWSPEIVMLSQLYAIAMFFMANATLRGILLLFDRFDLLAIQSAVNALIRLAGVILVFFLGGDIEHLLLIWFIAIVAAGLLLIFYALRELSRRKLLAVPLLSSFKVLRQGHEGIWSFALATTLNSNLALALTHLGTLLVGGFLGAAAAALFQIARDFTTALTKPGELLVAAIYPEYSKLAASGSYRQMGQFGKRAFIFIGLGLLVVLTLVAIFGNGLLYIAAGEQGAAAYPLLLALSGASVLVLWNAPLEPMLVSGGRQNMVLAIRVLEVIVFIGAAMPLLSQVGLIGVGLAALAARLCAFVLLLIAAIRWLQTKQNTAAPG
jgi:O-antigen/teichoic acid export membrane protein